MPTPTDWGRAYAQQALADFNAYNHLQGSGLPECQSLHFLQMTCEKLAKAYLCRSGSEPSDLMGSHAYTAKVIPLVLRDQMEIQNAANSLVKAVTQLARHLSREIELLAPSVDAGGQRPDNCEYPWESGNTICVPAASAFAPSHLLTQRHGVTILKLIQASLARLVA